MIRYIFSLIVFFVGIISMMVFSGSINYFVDYPSFVLVCIFPFLFVSTLFGFKKLCSVFSVVLKREIDEKQLLGALNFFKTYEKVTWMTSLIAVFVSFISMLGNIADVTTWGPNIAIVLISPLYGALVNLAIIIPFTVFINKHME